MNCPNPNHDTPVQLEEVKEGYFRYLYCDQCGFSEDLEHCKVGSNPPLEAPTPFTVNETVKC